jgi:hypothetical protein
LPRPALEQMNGLLEAGIGRLMPGARVELARGCPHQLLRLARLPFRHPGVV